MKFFISILILSFTFNSFASLDCKAIFDKPMTPGVLKIIREAVQDNTFTMRELFVMQDKELLKPIPPEVLKIIREAVQDNTFTMRELFVMQDKGVIKDIHTEGLEFIYKASNNRKISFNVLTVIVDFIYEVYDKSNSNVPPEVLKFIRQIVKGNTMALYNLATIREKGLAGFEPSLNDVSILNRHIVQQPKNPFFKDFLK